MRKRLNDYTTTEELYNIAYEMEDMLGAEELLHALIQALSTDDLKDNLQHIAKEYDLD